MRIFFIIVRFSSSFNSLGALVFHTANSVGNFLTCFFEKYGNLLFLQTGVRLGASVELGVSYSLVFILVFSGFSLFRLVVLLIVFVLVICLLYLLSVFLACSCLVFVAFIMAEVLISALDAGNPLYLHSSDSSSVSIVHFKLTGSDNYKMWYTAMKIALKGKNKMGFVDGSCVKPVTSHVLAQQWERCNAIVLGWILGSLSPEL